MISIRNQHLGFALLTQVLLGGILTLASNGCDLPAGLPGDGGSAGGGLGGGGSAGSWPIPTQMQWFNDQTVCKDPNGFGSYRERYPSVAIGQIVARADESVFGVGSYTLPSQGLGSQYGEYWGNGDITREGPHPYKIDIAAGGASASWSAVDFYYMSIDPLKACESGPWRGKGFKGPYLEPAGGDIAFYRQSGETYQCKDTYTFTCKFGELSKFAAPQWSVGTTEICAHMDFAFAGDAAGQIATTEDDRLKKYDPSGAVALDVAQPFGFTPNALALTATGDVYAAGQPGTDVQIARADASGALFWSKSFPNTIPPFKYKHLDFAVDDTGNSIVAFDAYANVDLGNGPLQQIGIRDVVLAKFDVQGNLLWAKRLGGFEILQSTMRKTGTNTIALAVQFNMVLDLGGTYHQSSPVLLKYDANGNLVSLDDLLPLYPGPAPEVLSFAISGHPSGAVFVAGSGYGLPSSTPEPNCDLGPSPLFPGTYPRPLRTFLAKYGP